MELIPYSSREGQIVLRHHNALVVRDHTSQRLEIRGVPVTECPTCKRPLRSSSPERQFDAAPSHRESWADPQYFRMLRAGYGDQGDPRNGQPSSPVRRLTQPTLPSGEVTIEAVDDAKFVSSTSAPQEGARIRRDAFSPNYFAKFFVEERELGRGGKGIVLLVRHEIDGCPLGHFACKRVPVGDDHAWLEKVLVEVELLATLSHPNLVSYRHVWLEDVQIHCFGPSVACAFILQQYCNNGDLLRFVIGDQPKAPTNEQLKAQLRRRSKGGGERPHGVLPSQRRLALEEIYSLFKDITSGLAYLHNANYIHRDMKPSNCLLHHENGKLICLLSDFGEVQPSDAVRKSTGATGTISYCAPEVLKMDARGQFGNFTVKSDVFSLGMILYFLCFGRLPYRNANVVQEELEDIDQLRAEIADWKGFQEERRERPDLPSKLYQLLKKMLALNPAERPSATEVLAILNHESSQGGLRGASRPASPLGIPGRRIQNLDSPIPPGTPQSEHPKQPAYDNGDPGHGFLPPHNLIPLPSEHSSQPASTNGISKYQDPSSPQLQSHAIVLSRSQEGRPSPIRPSSDSRSPSPHPAATVHTPLLMPVPLGPLGTFSHRAVLYQHNLSTFTRAHSGSILLCYKLILFLIKMASLTRVCWPFMVNVSIGIPLISAAALDLAVTSGTSNVIIDGGRPRFSARTSPVWHWGWKGSLILLALHFLALGATSRWGGLCVSAREGWVDW
ncbi:putative calcium-dependent protein kinase [Rosellinia necatrix]|uniref:non-specific serine/threonine protein kinase n=1 Tax=Rosellinia necatrix TaxID=77044 RepID=A0A1S8A6Z1_ROSNE|nr:putative calcium-dependent protein kinase [Rosellinia necatrix]